MRPFIWIGKGDATAVDVVSIGGRGGNGYQWMVVMGIGGWWWVSVDVVGISGRGGNGLGTGRDAVDPLDRDTSQGIGEIGKRRASRKFKKSENVHFSFFLKSVKCMEF